MGYRNYNERFGELIREDGVQTRCRIYFIGDSIDPTDDTAVQSQGTLLKMNSTDTDSNGRIAESGLQIIDQIVKENNATIGTCTSKHISITFLNTDGGLNNFEFGRCKIYIDAYDSENLTWETVSIGVYWIDLPVRRKVQFVEASGYDEMQLLDRTVNYSWLSQLFSSGDDIETTFYGVVNRVAYESGVSIAYPLIDFPSGTGNLSYVYTAPTAVPQELTYRNLLEMIAEALGMVCKFDFDGKLCMFIPGGWAISPFVNVDESGNGIYSLSIAEYETPAAVGVEVKFPDASKNVTRYKYDPSVYPLDYPYFVYTVLNNIFLYNSDATKVQGAAQNLAEYASDAMNLKWPVSIDLITDPQVESGVMAEVLNIPDVGNDILVMRQTLTWRGGYFRSVMEQCGDKERQPASQSERDNFNLETEIAESNKQTDALRTEFDAHMAATGTRVTRTAAPSVETGTWTDAMTIDLDPGVWIIYGFAQYAANATGYRVALLSRTSASSGTLGYGAIGRIPAVNGSATNVNCTFITTLTSSLTVHLILYQNSGSARTANCGIQAMRIA